MLTASPAVAAPGHGLTGAFGSEGSAAGAFEGPSGVAINEASGAVYVTDAGNNRVEEFGPTGTFISMFGAGVDLTKVEAAAPESEENVCTAASGDTCQAGAAGSAAGQLTAPEGIAIDNAATSPSHGDVYVIGPGHSAIDRFSSTGEYLGQLEQSEGASGGFAGVAVDPAGNVWAYANDGQAIEFNDEGQYVAGSSFNTGRGVSPGLAVDSRDDLFVVTGGDNIVKYSSTGQELGFVNESGAATSVVVASTTSAVYVGSSDVIFRYGAFGEPFGEPAEEFATSGQLAGGAGLAINASNGTVYGASATDDTVEIYTLGEPPTEPPVAKAPTNVGATTATLHGELNPGGATGKLDYEFDYNAGGSCAGGLAAPTPAGEAAEASKAVVSTDVTGLQPKSTYMYCLVARNAFGATTSANEEAVTTPSEVPAATAEQASAIGRTGGTLEAQVNPDNEETRWHFEYASNPQLSEAASTATGTLAPSYGGESATQTVTGLQPNTVYYYRIVAENGTGPATGVPVEQFRTAPPPPSVTTGGAAHVTAVSATLEAEIDPGSSGPDSEAKYSFEYSPEPFPANLFDCKAPCAIVPEIFGNGGEVVGEGTSNIAVARTIVGLQPLTTYHYRVLAYNNEERFEPIVGAEQQLTTLPLKPEVNLGVPVSVGDNVATMSAEVVAQGASTSYEFEYGTTTSFGRSTPLASAGSAGGGEYVTALLEGLEPNTTYAYRLKASNSGGEATTDIGTFTTTTPSGRRTETLPEGSSLTGTGLTNPQATWTPDLTGLGPMLPTPLRYDGAKPLTDTQELQRALKQCHKERSKAKRHKCELAAKAKFGAKRTTRG
jgi:hypothetical protein